MITLPAIWDSQPFLYALFAAAGFIVLAMLLTFALNAAHKPRATRAAGWVVGIGFVAVAVLVITSLLQSVATTELRQQALIDQAQDRYGVVLDAGQSSALLNGDAIVLRNSDQIGLKFKDDTHAKLIHIEPKNF
jgi:hypothetical protein